MTQKLSKSHASLKHLKKSKEISEEIKKKLKDASDAANIRIAHNNNVYKSSNSHAHEYTLKYSKN